MDQAHGTAKTTATEGEKRIAKKKVKKLYDAREKETSVPRGVKKPKKLRPDGGGYIEREGSVEQLPEIASPERARKGGRNQGRYNSKGMLYSLEGDESAHFYRDMRNSREEDGGNFGLGDSLMQQYNKYTGKLHGISGPSGGIQEARGQAGDANRTGLAFSPRRPGDPAAMLTNNKMINLVEQILGGSGVRQGHTHGDEIEIGSYQQSMLFPQYSQGQRALNLYRSPSGSALPQQADEGEGQEASTKLRQVSHLMNEMVRNSKPGQATSGPTGAIVPGGITITS